LRGPKKFVVEKHEITASKVLHPGGSAANIRLPVHRLSADPQRSRSESKATSSEPMNEAGHAEYGVIGSALEAHAL
jgi:hypothetical protein